LIDSSNHSRKLDHHSYKIWNVGFAREDSGRFGKICKGSMDNQNRTMEG
jgi:hypothetical protein